MALPPHIIRIKRKKNDQPVKSLYLEESYAQKRRRKTECFFEIVPKQDGDSDGAKIDRKRSSESLVVSSGVPSIRATLPGEEERDPQATRVNGWGQRDMPQQHTTGSAVPHDPNLPPRRFHLTITRKPSMGGLQKRRRDRADVATFIEKAPTCNKPAASDAREGPSLEDQKAYKRPRANPAEKQWRENQGRTTAKQKIEPHNDQVMDITTTTQPSTHETTDLAAHLQQWALEEINKQPSQPPPEIRSSSMKYQPKQVLRLRDRHDPTAPQIHDEDHIMSDDTEYVYDEYIRQQPDPQKLPNPEDVGVLVITDADQAEWETYIDDSALSSDEDNLGPDEEDENAENFHANDYPEDELSSSDEVGLGVYGHRRRGSDDEQFNDDDDDDDDSTGEWSNGDRKEPWERAAWEKDSGDAVDDRPVVL
ncbi:MAG: hypothetical protein M1817_001209 [Caeruleum heppii]|nr:MAG: hypothetical protein M1817_001209 [Caeruleum heppii]